MMGGKCTGLGWVIKLWTKNFGEGSCQTCSSNDIDSCQVVEQIEAPHRCPALSELLLYEEVPVPKKLNLKRWS